MKTKRSLDVAFLLCFAVAYFLICLCLNAVGLHREMANKGESDWLLTASMRVPSNSGVRYSRSAWPSDKIAFVEERLRGIGRLSPLMVRQVNVRTIERLWQATFLEIDPTVANRIGGFPHGRCSEGTAYVSGRGASAIADGSQVRIADESFTTASARLPWVGLFEPGTSGLIVVRCRSLALDRASWLLASGSEDRLKVALEELTRSPELSGAELFTTRLTASSLSERLASRADEEYGWIYALLTFVAGGSIFIAVGWGAIVGVQSLSSTRTRSLLGAQAWDLFRLDLARASRIQLCAAAAAVLAFLLTVNIAGIAFAPDAWVPMTSAFLVLVAAQIGFATMSLQRNSRRAMVGSARSTEGLAFSGSMRPYFMMWALGLAVSGAGFALSLQMASHVRSLQSADPGYDPENLWVVAARMEGDLSPEEVLGRYATIEQQTREVSSFQGVAIACLPPWRFDGFSMLDIDDGSTGLSVSVSRDFFRTIGVRKYTGELLNPSVSTGSIALQASSSEEAASYGSLFSVIGHSEGVLVGTRSLAKRTIVYLPLGSQRCDGFDLIVKAPASDLKLLSRLVRSLRASFQDTAFDEPVQVQQLFADARAPMLRIANLLLVACGVALILQVALSMALIVTMFAAQRREVAIRIAMGLTLPSLAIYLTGRLGVWAVPAVLLGSVIAHSGSGLFNAIIVDWEGILVSWSVGIPLVLAIANGAALVMRFLIAARDMDCMRELKV